jgi:hypothetical protein
MRGHRPQRRMTGAEFAAIRPLLTISAERAEEARLALVEGKTLQSIADIHGGTRQRIDAAVAAVWRVYERYQMGLQASAEAVPQLPPGWEKVTLIAPGHLIAKFRAEIAAAHCADPNLFESADFRSET